MAWSKVKNIIILILLLANLFLLLMIFTQARSSAQYQDQAMTDVLEVLERNGIHLDQEGIPESFCTPMVLQRDQEGEPALAVALLGPVEAQDLGSGRHRYRSGLGTAEFRSNGNFNFEFEAGALTVEAGSNEQAHALACMELLGFEGEVLSLEEDGASRTVVLRQVWERIPVFSCTVRLTYQDGQLRSIVGERLMGTPAEDSEGGTAISVPTALLRFLSGIHSMGDVCSEITSIQSGYLLSVSDTVRLTPAWYISTDTESYYLDGLTGALTKEG